MAASRNVHRRNVRQWYTDLVADFPEKWTLLDAVITVKYLDENGESQITAQWTPGLSEWEAVGMALYAQDTLRAAMNAPTEDN